MRGRPKWIRMWHVIEKNHQPGELRRSRLSIAVAVPLLCTFSVAPSSAAGYVKVAEFLPSSQRPRIVVQLEGKPIADARIEVYRDRSRKSRLLYTLKTGADGLTVLPQLRPGRYRVRGAAPKLWGEVYLEVSWNAPAEASQIAMEMESWPHSTLSEKLAAAEQEPIKDVLQTFGGVIADATGALIPGASIDVVRKGTGRRVHVARVRSDAQGRFSATLADGDYVVFFRASGFSERILPLTISRANGSGELQVRLDIGPSS